MLIIPLFLILIAVTMMEKEKLVKKVNSMHEQMNNVSCDEIAKVPEKETEPQTKLARREKDDNGIPYLQPKRRIGGLGKLPESLKKQHDHDWEYVKGIFENCVTIGEAIEFWFQCYPGDDNCLWSVPANRPVWVPRMIAKHLDSKMKYHKFGYREKNPALVRPDEFLEEFSVIETLSRGRFRAIGAFD